MPDSSPRSLAVVRALALLSWQRFRHTLGWLGKILPGMRQPTRGKNSRGGLFMLIFGGIFFFQAFFLSHKMVETYVKRSVDSEADVLSVSRPLFSYLESNKAILLQSTDQDFEKKLYDGFIVSIDNSMRSKWGLKALTSKKIIVTFREKGITGFRNYENIDLKSLRPLERVRFHRLIGMILLASLAAMLFMPLAMRERDLAATNDHLEWLFSLPLKGSELLLGKFVSIALIRPLVYLILWPILTNVLIANGQSVVLAAGVALIVAFLVSLALSGIEILIDTWLRSRGTAGMVKNIQMVFSITGMLSFYAVLAACFASGPSFPWVNWLAVRLPGSFGEPLGQLSLSSPGVLLGAVFFAAFLLGGGGFAGGVQLMRKGLLSGNVRQAKSRKIVGTDLRQSGLLRFEWLLLLRDRALATQVVLVPLLLVIYQLLVNPGMIDGATVGGICAMAYGCGTYASLVTAPQLLMSEAKGVWLIYNLPVPIAAYFRRRELVWRSVATGLAGLFAITMIIWTGTFRAEEIWRYLATLAGVWVMGRMVSGIVMGKPEMPDVASGERPKISFGRMYGAMILAGSFGALLWQGKPWPIISALVIFWFLGLAVWQRREISFSYLMEPTEKEPPSWGVDDGLWGILVFFVVQVIVALAMSASGTINGGILLISYVGGGVAALAFAWLRKRSKGLPLPALANFSAQKISHTKIIRETSLAILLCLAVGWLWTLVLKSGRFIDPSTASEGSDWLHEPLFWILAVIAAPLLEETIFRGFLFRTMMAFWSRSQAILGSALIFAIVHPGTSFPPVFFLGIATAVLYSRTRSLLPGIILHALYNLGILILASFG